MYVSIRRYKTDADQVGKIMQQVEDDFLPHLQKVPGFITYYGIDAGDGLLVFMNFFRDEGGAEESNRLASRWVKENLPMLFPLPQDVPAGEMMVGNIEDICL